MAVMMPREKWTDHRLDERFEQIEKRFDRLEEDIRELRTIMLGGFVTLLVAIIGTSVF